MELQLCFHIGYWLLTVRQYRSLGIDFLFRLMPMVCFATFR